MDEDFEDDWRVLRRKYADRGMPTTMNVGEAIDRLIKSLWKFLEIEDVADPAIIEIGHQLDKEKGAIVYRFRLFLPKCNLSSKAVSAEFLKLAAEDLAYHASIEDALEQLFNNVARILKQDREEFAATLAAEERSLIQRKKALRDSDENIAFMGQFDRYQEPLPIPEPKQAPLVIEVERPASRADDR